MQFLLGTREQLEPIWKAFADPAAGEDARALRAHRARRRARLPADRLPVRPPDRSRPRARSAAALSVSSRYDDLQFFGEWRPYQRAALAAFERDRQHGNLTTHIVAPPGSGKTLLGVELIRRVGKRALVLAPNQGIQQQWPRAVGQFTRSPADVAGADVLKPIACLSYQALCQLEDPEIVLGRLAQYRWADERAAATGMTSEEAQREGEAFEGAAADRRARDLTRISAALKREVARGEHAGIELRDLLSATARERVQHAGDARGRRRAARRVPSPRLAVGLRHPRRARRAARGRARDRPDRDAAGRAARGRGRALRRAARPGRLHRPDARGGARRAPRALPGAGVADRAAEHRARVAGRARQPLPRARDRAARRRRERDLVPRLGDRAPARPPPLARRRRRGAVGGVPEARAQARPRRHPLPATPAGWSCRPARRAARPTASRPISTTGSCCSRTTRCAASRRAASARRPSATTRSRRAARARLPAHAQGHPPRRVGGRPAADRLAGQGARAGRGARAPRSTRAAKRCAGSSCATPSWPPSAPTTR